jgi:hypothetical protein
VKRPLVTGTTERVPLWVSLLLASIGAFWALPHCLPLHLSLHHVGELQLVIAPTTRWLSPFLLCLNIAWTCARDWGVQILLLFGLGGWEAGHWAKAVVEGKIVKPRPTPKISQRSTIYIIVQGPRIDKPVRVASAARYYQLVPKFDETSLSHGWPSQAEAQVYCLALGIDYPAEV